ncbi:MAG: hypothetical protein ACYCVH_14560 [Ignavibacteriaceae bacterium]
MKKKWLLLVVIFSTAILFNACKNSNSVAAVSTGGTNAYFPNGNGSNFVYTVQSTDSTDTKTGTRSATYSGTSVIGGITFQKEIDTLAFGASAHVATSFFNVSSSEVDYFLDTTGLSASIPDSLIKYLSFSSTLKAFAFPFQSGGSWDVFDMGLKIGSFNIPIINVTAFYLGTEPITLNLTSGQSSQTAAKINYILTLTIPNLSNPLAPPATTHYYANAWLVQGIGVVKWHGSGAVFSAFSGNGVNISDSTTIVTQTLISYNLK